jgi:hypothetical protein
MKSATMKLVAALCMGAAIASGCVVETHDDTCDTSYATLTIENASNETVRVNAGGQVFDMADGAVRSVSLRAGSHQVTATGLATGYLLVDSSRSYACDGHYDLLILPGHPPDIDPRYAYLDLANDTGEQLDVYIDGLYMNRLNPGFVGEYEMNEGYHTIRVRQVDSGYDLVNQTEYFYKNTVTSWSVTSDLPEVEIHNLTFGTLAECVNTFVDTSPVLMDSGYYDVCPNEVGYFAVSHGDHLLEVFGDESSFQYVDAFQHFPENTVTVFEIE